MAAVYVSFHGGKGGFNNLHTYGLDGRPIGKAIDHSTLPRRLNLNELRGFVCGPDDKLYVANAHQTYSNIVRFVRAGNHVWSYDTVFVQGNTRQNPGLLHPYAIVFGPDDDLYVSSQDTGLVSRFAGPTARSPGAPRPTIVDGFPPGTFISLQNGAFQTGKYPIRGITFDAVGALYVANEKRDEIEVYDHAGAALPSIISTEDVKIDKPVQVRFDTAGTLYIGSAGNNAVLSYADNTLAALIGPHGAHLDAVSGIDVDSIGHLYVGSRKAKCVLRYDLPDTQPQMLLSGLDHKPEFVTIL